MTARRRPSTPPGTTIGELTPAAPSEAPGESPPAAAAASDGGELPEQIGPYRVLETLGRGGMGEVYLAYDDVLDRKVALKRVRPDRQGADELRRRFEIEARVTALLQHPAIIPVYSLLQDREHGTFYTMRPVQGMTLGDLVEGLREDRDSLREQWPTGRIVRLFLQATNAVAYAHSRGVVHRDLKPSNIMIGPFEEVLVLDWGVAKVIEDEPLEQHVDFDESSLERLRAGTSERVLIGTPAYMAPEQLENRAADFRTDVFSLGVILYELLAWRPPWKARSISQLLEAMRTPPEDPSLLAPQRHIPATLAETALRALALDPDERYQEVHRFSKAVARALEGRGRWNLRRPHSRDRWRMAGGRVRESGRAIKLWSRGQGPFRYFCTDRMPDNVAAELELRLSGKAELAIWLNTQLGSRHSIADGYRLQVIPGRRRSVSLERSGRIVAGARSPVFDRGRWYSVRASREDGHLTLEVDGEEIYAFSDPIPLTGGFVGLAGQSGGGVEVAALRIFTRGTDASVSCLAVPDAFFHRGLFEEARVEYDNVAASHPGRSEGRLARFRSGLCAVEMARREDDSELRAWLLTEAGKSFDEESALAGGCLGGLGRAIVALERGDFASAHDGLMTAFADPPGDPHRDTLDEWLLGQLHAAEDDQRLLLAELLPLAIDHCHSRWGRQLVRELVRRTRGAWETPSFMSGRGRFRANDAISRAEAKLFYAFWSGRSSLVVGVARELVDSGQARPHHVGDAVWSLLELEDEDGAREVLERAATAAERQGEDGGERWQELLRLGHSAICAAEGDLEAAADLIQRSSANPADRAYNSARLWLARAAAGPSLDDSAQVMRWLRRRGTRDHFAREHRAWYALLAHDSELAVRELKPMVEGGQHRTGRNLVNFLHGASQLALGHLDKGLRTFSLLEPVRWPRTWTLGSHAATGRLGEGRSSQYRRAAFPWEIRSLERHEAVLQAVGARSSR